jgi:hypothetical protein
MNRSRIASLVRRCALITGLGLCCLGTGCGSGGQTGGESPASDSCEARYEELTLDSPTPLGATPASVLEPVLGTHSSPLLWSANTGSLSIGPEQGLSQVMLTASYEGGRIAWARFGLEAASGAGDGPGSLLGCGVDRLEVELDVWLRTSGGALDEHFVVTLAAPAVDMAELTTRLPLDSLGGSFFVTAPAGVTSPAVRVTAVWDVFGFRGTVMGEVQMIYRDPNASSSADAAVGFGFVPFAEWPPPAGTAP